MQNARNKYNAKPKTVDGIRFHSTGEAKRWGELKLLERAGEISNLRRQVKHPIHVWDQRGNRHLVCSYVADFVYTDTKTDSDIVEDFKGVRTREFAMKARLFEISYGFAIKETGTSRRKTGPWTTRKNMARAA